MKALTRHCEAKGWIEKESDLADFFYKKQEHEPPKLVWNEANLYHLVILFHYIYTEKKWTRLTFGKAVWKTLAGNLRAFSQTPIKKNLQKIRHRLFDEYEKFEDLHADIHKIIAIVEHTKP